MNNKQFIETVKSTIKEMGGVIANVAEDSELGVVFVTSFLKLKYNAFYLIGLPMIYYEEREEIILDYHFGKVLNLNRVNKIINKINMNELYFTAYVDDENKVCIRSSNIVTTPEALNEYIVKVTEYMTDSLKKEIQILINNCRMLKCNANITEALKGLSDMSPEINAMAERQIKGLHM